MKFLENPMTLRLLYAIAGVGVAILAKTFDLGEAFTLGGAVLFGIAVKGEVLPGVAAAKAKEAARKSVAPGAQ